jgi:predicted helicase
VLIATVSTASMVIAVRLAVCGCGEGPDPANGSEPVVPRIPTPESRERFEQLADAGRKLADLHVNYETVRPYPLDAQLKPGTNPDDRETWRVQKMKWISKTDHSAIAYNSKVTLAGIPDDAERFLLSSRSALGWIIDRYEVSTEKASGIVNDPNDLGHRQRSQ